MNRRIEIIRILNNCLIIYLIFAVFLIGMGTPVSGGFMAGSLILVLMLLLSELMQAFVTNLILFLAGHIAVMVATGTAIYKVMAVSLKGVTIGGLAMASVALAVSIIIMTVVTILGIYTRVDGKGRFYPEIFEGALFVVLFIYCRITHVPQAEIIILLGEMVWGVMAVCYYNARQTIGALVTYHEGDFVPYNQIRKNNGVMLGISLGVTIVLMFLCTLLDYGKELLSAIRSAMVRFLTWLFSHFDFETPVEEEIRAEEVMSGGRGQLLPDDYVDDSIWHKIWDVLFWVVAAAVTILFIFVIIKLIKEFYKLFNNSGKGIRDRLSRDKREFLNPLSEKNDGAGESRSKGRMGLRERLTRRGNIRAMFIKYIQKGRGFADIRKGFTPSQMESVSLGKEADAYRIYEKARYSSEEISADDVDNMKKVTARM